VDAALGKMKMNDLALTLKIGQLLTIVTVRV
jgi:hypothetical protein